MVQTYSESETPDCFSVTFPFNYFEFFIRRKIEVTFFIKAHRIIVRVCMYEPVFDPVRLYTLLKM